MGLFDDFSKFFETRLEEFLRNNPHLELQALEEQLREQEDDTLRLIADLQRQEKKLEENILATAQEVKRWHSRVERARAANKVDLARAAEEREAELLRQGNQQWGQMRGCKERIEQAKQLYKQVHKRREEVKIKAREVEAQRYAKKAQSWETQAWERNRSFSSSNTVGDPLEDRFRRWETDEELQKMKRNMGN
ncbi:MAG: TIGR04376 family protein [Cyanobacteriota bacterium]|nr:TIGR04376 family protein [Cyanobacteriota bacterium]